MPADRGPHRRPQAALAFEIAFTRRNGLHSSQTVVRVRLGSPLDQEHCEYAKDGHAAQPLALGDLGPEHEAPNRPAPGEAKEPIPSGRRSPNDWANGYANP